MKGLCITLCIFVFVWFCMHVQKNDALQELPFQEIDCCLDLKNTIRRITKPAQNSCRASCLKDVYGITDSDYLVLYNALEDDVENLQKKYMTYAAEYKRIMKILYAELELIKSMETRESVALRERAVSMRDTLVNKATLPIKNIHQKIIAMAYFGQKIIRNDCKEHGGGQSLHICPWQKNSSEFLARAKNILGHYLFIFNTKLEQENGGWLVLAQRTTNVKMS